MKTLEIHNDLKKRLRTAAANGSVVAKDVLKALADGKTTTANANYFTSVRKRTLSEEGVSVYQIKITCCNKDIENPNFPDLGREDAQWLKHNRCEISALTFAEQFGLTGYSSDDVTYFVSAIGCPSKIHLELISSEQSMEQAYNVENYPNVRQNTDLSCTLHHSCMRHEETARRAADFYHNFAGAKMLVAKGDDGLIYGRSIIWKNIECVEYPQHNFSMIERVYCSYDFIYTMMMQWAEKKRRPAQTREHLHLHARVCHTTGDRNRGRYARQRSAFKPSSAHQRASAEMAQTRRSVHGHLPHHLLPQRKNLHLQSRDSAKHANRKLPQHLWQCRPTEQHLPSLWQSTQLLRLVRKMHTNLLRYQRLWLILSQQKRLCTISRTIGPARDAAQRQTQQTLPSDVKRQ